MPEVNISSLGWKIRHLKVSFIGSATDCKASYFPNLPYFAMPLVYLIQPLARFLEQKKSYNLQFDFMLTWQHKQQRALLFAWKLHKKTASKRSKTSNLRPTLHPWNSTKLPPMPQIALCLAPRWHTARHQPPSIGYFRYIKIQRDSESRRHKQQNWINMNKRGFVCVL